MSTDNKALQAELKNELASDSTKTVSEVAQKMQHKKTDVKAREYKNYKISTKKIADAVNAETQSERIFRECYVDNVTEKKYQLLNTTYANYNKTSTFIAEQFKTANIIVLTAEKMRIIAQAFIERKNLYDTFTVRDIRAFAEIRGKSQTDLPRSILERLSMYVTEKDMSEKFTECAEQAKKCNKVLMHCKVNDKYFLFAKIA